MLKVAHIQIEVNPEEVRELAMLLVRKQIKRVEEQNLKIPKPNSHESGNPPSHACITAAR